MKKSVFVMVGPDYVALTDVRVLDVEEDYLGRDLVTFEYNSKVFKSNVFKL